MSTKHDSVCLEKAGDEEPIFVLRAQDVTAPILVRVWARMVGTLQLAQDQGQTIEPILRSMAARLDEALPDLSVGSSAKLDGAQAIANLMEAWPHRKVPD